MRLRLKYFSVLYKSIRRGDGRNHPMEALLDSRKIGSHVSTTHTEIRGGLDFSRRIWNGGEIADLARYLTHCKIPWCYRKLGRGSPQNRLGIDVTGLDKTIPGHFFATHDFKKPFCEVRPLSEITQKGLRCSFNSYAQASRINWVNG